MSPEPDPRNIELPKSEKTSFKKILEKNLETFFQKTADDVCTPRNEIVSIAKNLTIQDALAIFKKHLFLHYPIHEENNPDEIVGFLNIKDILLNIDQAKKLRLVDVMHPTHFFSFSEPIFQVFEVMKAKGIKLAIVINEYGEMDGMILFESLLRVLLDNIYSEYDASNQPLIQRSAVGEAVIKGKYSLLEFNEEFDLDIKFDDIETISGYISHMLGRIPKIGETFDLGGIRYKILNSNNRKIDLLLVKVLKNA
ncbi:MAG: CBS domain-containing protein [SAR324 cluster bacterium]|nr:CBS domain-containing protein [SAR324 cluster bacterium]